MDKALEFLDSHKSDKLPDNGLADRLAIILDMIEDMRSIFEDFLRRESRDLRVMGQSGDSSPGAGANQPMGPTTSPTCAVQVASREDRAPPEAPGRHRKRGVPEEEDLAPQEAPRGAKRPRKGEEEWVAPPAAARRHFAHYVLHNIPDIPCIYLISCYIYAICIVYILYILSIYHVYVDLRHIPMCLAPSHVKHKNAQMQILQVHSLNILGISLAYHYKKRYWTNPFVLDQVYPRDMLEDYIYN
jgi:hypothetical protein